MASWSPITEPIDGCMNFMLFLDMDNDYWRFQHGSNPECCLEYDFKGRPLDWESPNIDDWHHDLVQRYGVGECRTKEEGAGGG